MSVDAFHSKAMRKVAQFVREAVRIFERPDVVSLASVCGARDKQTIELLSALAGLLGERTQEHKGSICAIRSPQVMLRITWIPVSSVGCEDVKAPWSDRAWFKDDHCAGPGQVLYVHADGRVAVCCGYANEHDRLVIGDIYKDRLSRMLKRAAGNAAVQAVYDTGLGAIRRNLEAQGVSFPGKTKDPCYFCHYLLTKNLLGSE